MREIEAEQFVYYGQRQNWRDKGGKEQIDVGGLLVTQGQVASWPRLLPGAMSGIIALPSQSLC